MVEFAIEKCYNQNLSDFLNKLFITYLDVKSQVKYGKYILCLK